MRLAPGTMRAGRWLVVALFLQACSSVPPPRVHLEKACIGPADVEAWSRAWQDCGPLDDDDRRQLIAEGLAALSRVAGKLEIEESANQRDAVLGSLVVAWDLVSQCQRAGALMAGKPLAPEVASQVAAVGQHADAAVVFLERAAQRLEEKGELVGASQRLGQALRICPTEFRPEQRARLTKALRELTETGLRRYLQSYRQALADGDYIGGQQWLARIRALDPSAPVLAEWRDVQRRATDQHGRARLAAAERMLAAGQAAEALAEAEAVRPMLLARGPADDLAGRCKQVLAARELRTAREYAGRGQHRDAVFAARRSLKLAPSAEASEIEQRSHRLAERRIAVFPIRNLCDGLDSRWLERKLGGSLRAALRQGLGGDEWHAFVPDRDLDRVLKQIRFNERGRDIDELLEELRHSSLTAHYAVDVELREYHRNQQTKVPSRHTACRLLGKRTVRHREVRLVNVPQFYANGWPVLDRWRRQVYRPEPRRVTVSDDVYDYHRETYTIYRDRVDEWIEASLTVYRFDGARASEPFFRTTDGSLHGRWTASYVDARVPLSELRELPPDGASLTGHGKLTERLRLREPPLSSRDGVVVTLGAVDDRLLAWLHDACVAAAGKVVASYR